MDPATLSIRDLRSGLRRVRSIRDVDVRARRVLVRADLDVPLQDGRVVDDARVRRALPTLEYLRDHGARIVVCTHVGRPDGVDPAWSTVPVRECLGRLFEGPLEVLENTRFSPGEAANDAAFARSLAEGCDLFVQDAFAVAHREHASTVGVAGLLPAYAGLLLERELAELGQLLGDVRRPFVVVVGGAAVEDKIDLLERLGSHADALLVGGRMASALRRRGRLTFEPVLPVDVVAAPRFAPDAEPRICTPDALPDGWVELDIGPVTRRLFASHLSLAGTIFWNGPPGVFEWPRFAAGTEAIATAIATARGHTVAAGGDTARALAGLGLARNLDWISTGGGAALELLAGHPLPALDAIPER